MAVFKDKKEYNVTQQTAHTHTNNDTDVKKKKIGYTCTHTHTQCYECSFTCILIHHINPTYQSTLQIVAEPAVRDNKPLTNLRH